MIPPHLLVLDFCFSLCAGTHPLTQFHPDATAHFPPVSLPSASHPASVRLSLCLSFAQGYNRTSSSSSYRRPPPFFFLPLIACDIKCSAGDVRDPVRRAPSLLSDSPQSQSLPLSAAEVHTHGKLIPMPCLLHIVLVSEVVHCVETVGVIFWKDRHTVGSHYTSKTHT